MITYERKIWNDGPAFDDFMGREGAPPVAQRHLASGGGGGMMGGIGGVLGTVIGLALAAPTGGASLFLIPALTGALGNFAGQAVSGDYINPLGIAMSGAGGALAGAGGLGSVLGGAFEGLGGGAAAMADPIAQGAMQAASMAPGASAAGMAASGLGAASDPFAQGAMQAADIGMFASPSYQAGGMVTPGLSEAFTPTSLAAEAGTLPSGGGFFSQLGEAIKPVTDVVGPISSAASLARNVLGAATPQAGSAAPAPAQQRTAGYGGYYPQQQQQQGPGPGALGTVPGEYPQPTKRQGSFWA